MLTINRRRAHKPVFQPVSALPPRELASFHALCGRAAMRAEQNQQLV